jgi:hypothetical protein
MSDMACLVKRGTFKKKRKDFSTNLNNKNKLQKLLLRIFLKVSFQLTVSNIISQRKYYLQAFFAFF